MIDLSFLLALGTLVVLVGGLNWFDYRHRHSMTPAERAQEERDIRDDAGMW